METENRTFEKFFPKYGLRECQCCRNVNPKHSNFCENCGKRLVTVSTVARFISTRFKTLPVKVRKCVSLSVISIIAVLIVLNVLAYIFDPIHTVNKYYKALANKDYEAIYECFGELPNGDFINKHLYFKLNENVVDSGFNGKIINYQITPVVDKVENDYYSSSSKTEGTDKIAKYYMVAYSETGTDRISKDSVTLIKQQGKNFLIFDKWAVAPKDIIVDNCKITTLKGASITLNGTELGAEYLSETDIDSSAQYDNYIIPTILQGTYEATIKLPYSQEITKDVRIETSNNISLTDGFLLEKTTEDELAQKIVESISQIYNAIIEGKDFSAVKSLFAEGDNNAEYSYNNVFNNYHQNSRMLKKFSVEFSGAISDNNVQISNRQVSIRASYSYNYTIEVAKGWYGNEFEVISNSSSGNTTAIFIYENGQWVLNDFINLPSINYY